MSTEVQARPMSAQLVKARDQVVDFPADALVWLGREAATAYLGALLILDRHRAWRTDAEHRALLRDQSTLAKRAGGKLPVASEERSLQRRANRTRLTIAVVGATLVTTTGVSIESVAWGAWQWAGAVAGLAVLGLAHEYRLRALLALAPIPPAVGLLLGVESWRWWPVAVLLATLTIVCDVVGRAYRPPPPRAADRPADVGVSFPMLWESIRLRLLEERITAPRKPHGARPLVVDGDEVGVAFRFVTREPMTDKAVAAIAREIGLGTKWVRWVHTAEEAGGELVIYFRNPLGEVPPPPSYRFGDLHYGSDFSIGKAETGDRETLNVGYTHGVIAGRTGSGKSSVMRDLIDAVEYMPDAEFYGVDTVGHSTIGAQRKRLGPDRVACGPDEVAAAERILDRLIAIDAERGRTLGGDDYDEDGEVDERFLVDDVDGRRGIVLVIGEYRDFCRYPHLVTKLLILGGRSRKDAISIWVETPTLAKEELGEGREFFKMAMTKIALAMLNQDVPQYLGAGELEAGWRPDHLEPESEGVRNDAGLGYIHGGSRKPRLVGFHPMPPALAEARRRARRPERDAWYAHLVSPPDPHDFDAPDIVDAEVVSEEEMAREAAIRKALDACGDRPGLPVREAADVLSHDERAHVRRVAKSDSLYFAEHRGQRRCHPREALVRALAEPHTEAHAHTVSLHAVGDDDSSGEVNP